MERYQDYVIKDGKFVGKFEEMYQRFEDPWHQASIEYNQNSFSRNMAILFARQYKIESIVEFGCGLGFYTQMLQRETGARVKGVDISETAVKKARSLWPHLDFAVDKAQNVFRYNEFQAVLFAELTWYILEDLKDIFDKMLEHFKGRNAYFLNNLVFYKGQQRYGNNYFTNLTEFIDFVPLQMIGYSESSTVNNDDSIETSTIFRIKSR